MSETTFTEEQAKAVFRTSAKLTKEQVDALKSPGLTSRIRRSMEVDITISKPTEFYAHFEKPVQSRLATWLDEVKEKTTEQLDTQKFSRLVEIDPNTGKWRWRMIRTWAEFKDIQRTSEASYDKYMRLCEAGFRKRIKESFGPDGGYGFASAGGGAGTGSSHQNSFPVRHEYTPLIGTPFFKQLYLTDYWLMHSKCFWWSNYSAIGKMVMDITRNFVMGQGFTVTFTGDDKNLSEKADGVWKAYEDRTKIQDFARQWCDDHTRFGECMVRRIPTRQGLLHRSFDPSICWEIVTQPSDITDIAYYHNQWQTQYQIETTKNIPSSEYIIEQLPPAMVIHSKVNITSYEKRGRADLLAPLLYLKYYEDYMQARLLRAKNEAAFIWDVSIDGADEDVKAYIDGTESLTDVPPGSENVHNKAIVRTPLSPTLSATAKDNVALDILSMVAMGTSIPVSFFGTAFSGGGSTKAGALVNSEPVVKKMMERQNVMKSLLRQCVIDVMMASKIDVTKLTIEVGMPDILQGDSQAKIKDLYMAKDEKVLSHKSMAHAVAKELKWNRYDYDEEQKQIELEMQNTVLMPEPDPVIGAGGAGGAGADPNHDLTKKPQGSQDSGRDKAADTTKDSRDE